MIDVSNIVVLWLDEFFHWNDALFVSFHLFKEIVGLDLGQNLDDSSLHLSTCHQTWVIWCCKSFFKNLYSLNRFHSVSNLVVLFCHKLTSSMSRFTKGFSWENENITFWFEIDLVKNFDTWVSRIKIAMEMRNVFKGKSIQFSHLKE